MPLLTGAEASIGPAATASRATVLPITTEPGEGSLRSGSGQVARAGVTPPFLARGQVVSRRTASRRVSTSCSVVEKEVTKRQTPGSQRSW